MTWTMNEYRVVAMALWGFVSVAVGLSIGFYFNMSEKKILFVVVVAIGLYVLALLRASGKREGKEQGNVDDESVDSFMRQADTSELSGDGKGKRLVMDIEENESKLTDDESRVWLDDFLVKQQKDL